MSEDQLEYDLELISEADNTTDEWVREGSTISSVDTSPRCSGSKELNNGSSSLSKNIFKFKVDRLVNLLGVRNKPDPMANWDNMYNLPQQNILRNDCRQLIKRNGDASNWTLPQIESMITLYCKQRKVGYEPGECWLDILGKLLLLPFDHCALFNVFWAITTKYVPRSAKMFDLYRLLLQYHDPKLCSYLDSFRIQSDYFTKDWFCSLLSKDTSADLCWAIWDKYFEKGDPYLIFFIALAFAQGAREEIFQLTNHEQVLALLRSIPSRMSIEDVPDLLEICYLHLTLTPISIREDFHCMLFGSNLVDEYSEIPLNCLICLPISVQELCRRAIDVTTPTSTFGYFIIDTRAQKYFNAGCIPGSYNLNAETIIEDPEKFGFAMNSLMRFKEDNYPKDHLVFLGSGREGGDQYMHMVIAKFLQQNYEHISYVDGGYRMLHQMLIDTDNITKLSNHFNKTECAECKCVKKEPNRKTIKSLSFLEKLKKMNPTSNRKSSLKGIGFQKSTEHEEKVKHVCSVERFGKRYRNVQSVFSINNDDSQSSDNDMHNMLDLIDSGTRARDTLRWSDVMKKAGIGEHFEGEEVSTQDSERVPCYIGLSMTHMHIFHKVPGVAGMVHPSLRHSLSSIMRVSSKRRFPEFLTFKFGYELPTGESHINRLHYFILPKAGDCAKAVKLAILALRPSTIKDDETHSES